MLELLARPWPWYVAGPLIGLMVPVLLLAGNHAFGVSSNFRHACAAWVPGRAEYLRYDWRRIGGWNLAFGGGIVLGGALAAALGHPEVIEVSARTREDLAALGLHDPTGFVPSEIFGLSGMLSLRGLILLLVGGFAVGFGTSYAGGCTSGHGVTGLANFQLPSLIAVLGFFAGGLVGTYFLLPLLL